MVFIPDKAPGIPEQYRRIEADDQAPSAAIMKAFVDLARELEDNPVEAARLQRKRNRVESDGRGGVRIEFRDPLPPYDVPPNSIVRLNELENMFTIEPIIDNKVKRFACRKTNVFWKRQLRDDVATALFEHLRDQADDVKPWPPNDMRR